MHARLVYTLASVIIILTQAPIIAYGQSSLDIPIPLSFPINASKAYDSSDNVVDVGGHVDLIKYGSGVYVTIPTNAPDGSKLSFFQDTGTWALFRNNTLMLPVGGDRGPVASFVLATGDLVSGNGRFYGQVTGIELDTKALDIGSISASAVLYLDELPDKAAYRFAIVDNTSIKKAVLSEAPKSGSPDAVILMVEVSGSSQDARSSIGYTIVRMMLDGAALNGNVSAYRYDNGVVSRLPGKSIESANGTFYETISSGPGTFVFVGPYQEPPRARAGIENTLMFAGALALLLALLVGFIMKSLRWSTKKE